MMALGWTTAGEDHVRFELDCRSSASVTYPTSSAYFSFTYELWAKVPWSAGRASCGQAAGLGVIQRKRLGTFSGKNTLKIVIGTSLSFTDGFDHSIYCTTR